MKTQRGFTLIELVVVIVILGAMAAIALPKFVDVTVDAHNAAARGVAGAISSGSAVNYGTRLANPLNGVAMNAANVCTAAILQTMLTGATVTLQSAAATTNDQFQVTGTGNCSAPATTPSVTCTITPSGSSNGTVSITPATATLLCVN